MAAAKSKPLTIDELIDAQRAMLTRSEKLTEKQIKHAEDQIKKLEEIRAAVTIQNMEELKETLDTRTITKIKGDAQHVTLGDIRTQLKTLDKNIQEALANSSGMPVKSGRKTFPGLKVIQGGAQTPDTPATPGINTNDAAGPLKNIGGKFNPNNRGNTGNFYDAFSALVGKKTVLKEGFAFDPSLKGSGIRSTRTGSKGQVADAAQAKMGRLGGAASILGNMALEKNEANIESMYSPGLSKFFGNFLPPHLARQPNSQPDTVNPITGSRANTRPKLVGIDGGKGKTATAVPATMRANVLNVTATTVNIKGKTGSAGTDTGSTQEKRTMRGGDTIKTAATPAAGAGGGQGGQGGGDGGGGFGLGDLADLIPGKKTLGRAGSMLRAAAPYAAAGAVMYGAGRAVDYGLGAMGVGKDEKGNDLQVDTKADDSNWDRMSMLEKAQSGIARGIEKAGDFVAPNMANQARADRVKKESEYFAKQDSMLKGNKPTVAPALPSGVMAAPPTAPPTAAPNNATPQEPPEVEFRRSKMTSSTIGGRVITGYEGGYNLHGKKEDVEEADAAYQEFRDAKSDAEAEAAATKFKNLAANIESEEYKAKMKKIGEEQAARKKNKQVEAAATPKAEQGSENPPASVTPKKSDSGFGKLQGDDPNAPNYDADLAGMKADVKDTVDASKKLPEGSGTLKGGEPSTAQATAKAPMEGKSSYSLSEMQFAKNDNENYGKYQDYKEKVIKEEFDKQLEARPNASAMERRNMQKRAQFIGINKAKEKFKSEATAAGAMKEVSKPNAHDSVGASLPAATSKDTASGIKDVRQGLTEEQFVNVTGMQGGKYKTRMTDESGKEITGDQERITAYKKGRDSINDLMTGSLKNNPTPKVDGARAAGGPVARGKSYLVGEKGPEVIKPTESGKVIPNNQLTDLQGQDLKDFQKYSQSRAQIESAETISGFGDFADVDQNLKIKRDRMARDNYEYGEKLKARGIDVDAHYNRPEGAAEPKMGEVGYKSLDERYGKAKTLDTLSAFGVSGASKPAAPVIITNNNTTGSKGSEAPMMRGRVRNEESSLARYGNRTSSFY